ncbi:MAG: TrbI/VirB10 family protein [Verrucomicrobiales bacterium]|nr:TrbI/VirB10 family protein [Verrucomicrobiales bacterium]
MNRDELVDFVRTRGLWIVLVMALVGLVWWLSWMPRRSTGGAVPLAVLSNPPPARSLVRDSVPLIAVTGKPPVIASPRTSAPLAALHLHVAVPTVTNPPVLGRYAPAGRLIRAVTVNALNSASIETPIIALVTDDVWHDGQQIVPAGTELHGRAALDRTRDRIVSQGPWTLVWQTGEELVVSGIALDREDAVTRDLNLDGDGVAGLRGRVIRSQSAEEIRLFAASFLSGVASGLQTRRTTAFGTEVLGTAQNAALNGAGEVLNAYAREMTEAIRRDGVFVAVPAGHPLYLYVPHTLDLGQLRIGALRASTLVSNSVPPAALSRP